MAPTYQDKPPPPSPPHRLRQLLGQSALAHCRLMLNRDIMLYNTTNGILTTFSPDISRHSDPSPTVSFHMPWRLPWAQCVDAVPPTAFFESCPMATKEAHDKRVPQDIFWAPTFPLPSRCIVIVFEKTSCQACQHWHGRDTAALSPFRNTFLQHPWTRNVYTSVYT